MKYCPVCETDYPDDVKVCPQDGAAVRRPGERADPFLGRVIKGRYRVERQAGRGGMGTVYLAEQLSVGRKVALKVLRGDFAREEGFVARFQQEAKLVASLNERRNPRVTLVHDFDQTEDGSVFIVMEWLEGRVLNEVIQRDRGLDLPRAVRLATQIAEGLEAAHRTNVVHRDVKPQNIMVLEAGDDIKLMDFGIARLRDSGTNLTRTGTMMGTPAYMSPEQIEGQEITEKTDMYAFGIVLYEMLTGVVPFRASTQAAVLTKQLQEQPVPPSRLRPEIPQELEAIVLKALEKDPAKRERDMAAMVRALREMSRQLGEVSTDTSPPPARRRSSSTARRRRPRRRRAPKLRGLRCRSIARSSRRGPRCRTSRSRAPPSCSPRRPRRGPRPGRPPARRRTWGGDWRSAGSSRPSWSRPSAPLFTWCGCRRPPPRPRPPRRPRRHRRPVLPRCRPALRPRREVRRSCRRGHRPRSARRSRSCRHLPSCHRPSRRSRRRPLLRGRPRRRARSRPRPSSRWPSRSRIRRARTASAPGWRSASAVADCSGAAGPIRTPGVTVEVGPNGVVTLRGIVRDATQRDEAANLVRMAGVNEVRLRVNVQSSWN